MSIVDINPRLLINSGRPPTGGDGMEARLASLEAHMTHVYDDVRDIKAEVKSLRAVGETNFKITWGGLIFAVLGLAGIMAKGFGWL